MMDIVRFRDLIINHLSLRAYLVSHHYYKFDLSGLYITSTQVLFIKFIKYTDSKKKCYIHACIFIKNNLFFKMSISFQKSILLATRFNKKCQHYQNGFNKLTSLITLGSFQKVTNHSIPCVSFVSTNDSGAASAHGPKKVPDFISMDCLQLLT